MAHRQTVRLLTRFLQPTIVHAKAHAGHQFATTGTLLRTVLQSRTFPAAFLHTSRVCNNEHIFSIQEEEDFKLQVLENASPVLVQFHASWCGPCKMLGPRLEEAVTKADGKVKLAKVDIDELSDLAIDYGVEAVPTVLGLKNGEVVDRFVGLKDDADLESFIGKVVG